jgi:hypothetical protein
MTQLQRIRRIADLIERFDLSDSEYIGMSVGYQQDSVHMNVAGYRRVFGTSESRPHGDNPDCFGNLYNTERTVVDDVEFFCLTVRETVSTEAA